MRYKTLLLGTATAIAVAGGNAQAADLSLSVTEPVDYVRVCDAFGVGFWYIPGTDTCLAIGGYVRVRAMFGEGVGDYIANDGDDDDDFHYGDWQFRTNAVLNVTASSMTDWGPLVGFLEFEGEADRSSFYGDDDSDDDSDYGSHNVFLGEAYLSLGPILAGYTQSLFDIGGGGYTYEGFDLSDQKLNQFRLSWAMNGFGLAIGLEDGAERWGTDETNDFPDITAALTAGGGGWDAGLSFLYTDQVGGGKFAVEAFGEIDVMGDSLKVVGLWHDSALSGDLVGDEWAILASFQHNWTSNLYSAISFQYPDTDDWGLAFNTVYSPVEGFKVGGEVVYDDASGDFTGQLRMQRDIN